MRWRPRAVGWVAGGDFGVGPMSKSGTVKTWNDDKGFGFIGPDDTRATGRRERRRGEGEQHGNMEQVRASQSG